MRRPKRKSLKMRNLEVLKGKSIEMLLSEMYLEQKLTQYEIADQLGVTQTCISQWLHRFHIEYREPLLAQETSASES